MTTVALTPVARREAARLSVHGVVQGVGFRPFVHRLALRLGVFGWVRNASGDVQIHIEGAGPALNAFLEILRADAPPLARIDSVHVDRCEPAGLAAFTILQSRTADDRRQPIAPDVALCAACEAELFDPANRRHRYPFITCTDCGPRFTVIESMPYDRERTSMRAFQQCGACAAEYATPGDRRYHSETNSCAACGPGLWLEYPDIGTGVMETHAPLPATARLLLAGQIVAVRGLGGFQLAVDATNEAAVARLRMRKRRDAKPLAVMVRTLAAAAQLGEIGPVEAALLTSRERPIVVLHRKGATLAPSIAPDLDTVGVMLAYTPLHHLLCDLVRRPLVMTSGNVSDEPIAIHNDAARARLGEIADAFLVHDREITARYDDSVVRVTADAPVLLRRARGYAPLPVALPLAAPRALVAVGPHLKNTFTLVARDSAEAYVSQHIGDLESLETLAAWRDSLATYRRLFRVAPEVAVRDLHPGYLSTRIAGELDLERVIAVQHHHAHIAAVMAEHGTTERVLGLAFDGTGYGSDGNVWGAEFLLCSLTDYRRLGQLRYARLPGGDAAAREPWRAALGYLALEPDAVGAFGPVVHGIHEERRAIALQQVARRLNAPLASSMGRLFDAAAAVLGVRLATRYEGQAAMELEALAGRRRAQPFAFPAARGADGVWVLDPVPLLVALGERRAAGDSLRELAARFHESVAAGADYLAARLAADARVRTVALGGGCFQNARLLESLRARLQLRGLRVLVPQRLGPNDGAISYGQAAIAAALLRQDEKENQP